MFLYIMVGSSIIHDCIPVETDQGRFLATVTHWKTRLSTDPEAVYQLFNRTLSFGPGAYFRICLAPNYLYKSLVTKHARGAGWEWYEVLPDTPWVWASGNLPARNTTEAIM